MDSVQAAESVAGGRDLVSLFEAVAAGDRAALTQLYDRTSAKLYGICVRMLPSEADAQEVLQDVYVLIWQKASRYDAARASPITWLATLTRNRAIDRLRLRKSPTSSLDDAAEIADQSATAFDVIEAKQESKRLADCLEQLDERQQTMIRAAFLEGATYSNLAERESVPLGTMKSWIRRALLRLRGCLEQ